MISNHRPKVVFWIDVVQHLSRVETLVCGKHGQRGERTDLLYPVFPVVCAVISPPGTRYSTVPHHKEWHHLGDNLTCTSLDMSKFTARLPRQRTANAVIRQNWGLKECFSHGERCCERAHNIFRIPFTWRRLRKRRGKKARMREVKKVCGGDEEKRVLTSVVTSRFRYSIQTRMGEFIDSSIALL